MQPAESNQSENKIHILLVEDSLTHYEMIRDALFLVDRHVEVTVARSIAEGRERLAEFQPDLAIVDLLLPDGKGIELLPADKNSILFPLVILTSQGNEKEAVEAMRAGALDYLVKSPMTLAEMPRIIARVMREWGHIAERRRAEETLRQSEERFRSVFVTAAAGIVIIAPAGTIIQSNPWFCRFLRYTEAELMNFTIEDVTHPEDRKTTINNYADILSGKRKLIHYEKRYLRKDGRVVWGHASMACVFDSNFKPIYFIGLVQDISDQKRAEEELRKSEQQLRELIEASPVPMVISENNYKLLYLNKKFTELFGYTVEDIPTIEAWWPLAYPDPEYRRRAKEAWSLIVEKAKKEKSVITPQEARVTCKDGSVRHIVFQLSSIGDLELFVLNDMTERMIMEEVLLKANRELDAFVYTASHDLRSPLTPILGYAEYMKEVYSDRLDEQGIQCLEEIEKQGKRMLKLLEDLLDLARMGYLERPVEPVDVGDVVEEVVQGLMGRISAAEMRVEASSLPSVYVPRTLLVQIFDNLIGNATRYAGTAGVLEVFGERRKNKVRLYIRDHGPGIPEDEHYRVFELFYRGLSGRKSEGTGVGLASVKRIARLYGGDAWVENTPGGGCTFVVELIDESGKATISESSPLLQ